jgi:hypothetical protein
MAKATAYTATASNGQVFTRNSHRVYTHACLALRSEAADRALCDADWKVDGQNFDYLVKIVETNGTIHNSFQTAEQCAERAAKAKADIEAAGSRAGYIAACRARRVAKVDADKAAGAYEKFHLIGFAGRLDLAQKAFARDGKMYHKPEFVTVEVK